MCVYASLTAIDALLVFVFPETKGKDMPDSVSQAESKKRKKKEIQET
jgi:hypothetical protein